MFHSSLILRSSWTPPEHHNWPCLCVSGAAWGFLLAEGVASCMGHLPLFVAYEKVTSACVVLTGSVGANPTGWIIGTNPNHPEWHQINWHQPASGDMMSLRPPLPPVYDLRFYDPLAGNVVNLTLPLDHDRRLTKSFCDHSEKSWRNTEIKRERMKFCWLSDIWICFTTMMHCLTLLSRRQTVSISPLFW